MVNLEEKSLLCMFFNLRSRGFFLFHRKHLVTLKHERPAVSYEIKNAPRGMRIRAYKENVAFATALSARVRKRTLC